MKLLIAVQLGEFFLNIVVKCQELLRSVYVKREETENNSREKCQYTFGKSHGFVVTIIYVFMPVISTHPTSLRKNTAK